MELPFLGSTVVWRWRVVVDVGLALFVLRNGRDCVVVMGETSLLGNQYMRTYSSLSSLDLPGSRASHGNEVEGCNQEVVA